MRAFPPPPLLLLSRSLGPWHEQRAPGAAAAIKTRRRRPHCLGHCQVCSTNDVPAWSFSDPRAMFQPTDDEGARVAEFLQPFSGIIVWWGSAWGRNLNTEMEPHPAKSKYAMFAPPRPNDNSPTVVVETSDGRNGNREAYNKNSARSRAQEGSLGLLLRACVRTGAAGRARACSQDNVAQEQGGEGRLSKRRVLRGFFIVCAPRSPPRP
ncbi:hypothetical protein BC628DRAFT_91313 [Trametes gibbosa]|nr:hypothetical protein BC628DRAFT_91313 [Trametes gibbosa]